MFGPWITLKKIQACFEYFLSKLIERVVALRLHDHMKINNLYGEFQSSYRKLHITETALTSVHDDILRHIDEKQCVILLLLD